MRHVGTRRTWHMRQSTRDAPSNPPTVVRVLTYSPKETFVTNMSLAHAPKSLCGKGVR